MGALPPVLTPKIRQDIIIVFHLYVVYLLPKLFFLNGIYVVVNTY